MKTIFTGGFLDLKNSFKVLGIDFDSKKIFSWESLKKRIELHTGQQELKNKLKRFNILVAGRRWGKTHFSVNGTIRDCINNPGISSSAFPVVCLVGMPTYPMLRRVFWSKLKHLLKNCPYVEDINNTNFSIDFTGDRPSINCIGLNDGDGERARGLKIFSARIDEAQGLKPDIIKKVILPTLIDTPGSTLLLSGTPKGKTNELYYWWQFAETNSEWSRHLFKTIDNPTLRKEDLEIMRSIMDEKSFRQECEGSFEEFEGQIYYTLNREIHLKSKHLIDINFESLYMGVDWGDRWPAYVIIGRLKKIYYLVESWVNDGKKLVTDDEFDRRLIDAATRWKVDQTFCDPAESSSILRLRGYEPIGLRKSVRGFNRVEEGIKVINSLLHREYFLISTNCIETYDRLEGYSRELDDLGKPTEKVAPKQQDHDVDAIRMILATLEYKNYVNASNQFEKPTREHPQNKAA